MRFKVLPVLECQRYIENIFLSFVCDARCEEAERISRTSSTHFDEETQRLESIYQQKLAALDALKKSLLDQAFTGQL